MIKKIIVFFISVSMFCIPVLARDAGDGEHDKDPIDPSKTNKSMLPIDYEISTSADDYRVHMSMQLHSSAATLRTSPMGTKITVIPNGSSFEINKFQSTMRSDGYRWVEAYYWMNNNNQFGYCQYDPVVMYPYGYYEQGAFTNMRLDSSAARLRETVMGRVITTVPVGQNIKTTNFYVELQADGYRWNNGSYNGSVGVYQYDPAVMYPYDY